MFLMVIVSFLRFAMQKYSISPNVKQLVKPFRGLVYHVAKIQKIKRLDFKLLQNLNPTVVYGVVYHGRRIDFVEYCVFQCVSTVGFSAKNRLCGIVASGCWACLCIPE